MMAMVFKKPFMIVLLQVNIMEQDNFLWEFKKNDFNCKSSTLTSSILILILSVVFYHSVIVWSFIFSQILSDDTQFNCYNRS